MKSILRLRYRPLIVLSFSFLLIALFQNCDGGFHFDPAAAQMSLAATAGIGSSDFKLTTYDANGVPFSEGLTFDGGAEYKITASGNALGGALLSWGLTENTGNCSLRPGSNSYTRFISCDQSGRVTLRSSAIWPDGKQSVLTSSRTTAKLVRDLCGTSDYVRVVFRIPEGTGVNPWNAVSAPVTLFVGQTLRICNDDTTASHQLGTSGSPCPQQPAPMAAGEIYDCQITNATTTGLFDAVVGASSPFSIRTVDGYALYADTTLSGTFAKACQDCHNPIANSTRKGRTFADIKAAILANRGGVMGNFNGIITDEQIQAIAFALSQ